jgi:hypothetical protein
MCLSTIHNAQIIPYSMGSQSPLTTNPPTHPCSTHVKSAAAPSTATHPPATAASNAYSATNIGAASTVNHPFPRNKQPTNHHTNSSLTTSPLKLSPLYISTQPSINTRKTSV